MNLLEFLKREISDLKLKNKYEILRYIYIRTGELFDYDPLWKFANEEEKEKIKNKRIDINNVTDFDIVCFGWARMYQELLKHFDISSEVIKNDNHAFVIIYIDEKKILADLTNNNEDITRIKFGMKIQDNRQVFMKNSEEQFNFTEIDNKIYNKKINMEGILETLKQELVFLKNKFNYNKEVYVYKVFKLLEIIMSFPRQNVGYVSGITFIEKLYKLFLDSNFTLSKTYYYDKDKKIYMLLYCIIENEKKHYFMYFKNVEGFYKFKEIKQDKIIDCTLSLKKLKC